VSRRLSVLNIQAEAEKKIEREQKRTQDNVK
jgi:hypothetical protein